MTVTIRQIAEKAGVSRGTVDRVLNGRPGVKPQIRERIMAIAHELNYVPNMAAKALALNKNPVKFGVVMPPKEIAFFGEVRSGITAAAEELKDFGIAVEYRYVDNRRPEEGAAAIGQLIGEGVSGILVSLMDDELIRARINDAAAQGIPVVTFNSDVGESKRVCFVGQDLYRSGQIAAGLMRRMLRGKARVLVLASSMSFQAHRSRVNGFRDVLSGTEMEIVQLIQSYDRYADTHSQVSDALARHTDLDGIYMATGDVAGCLDAVMRAGLGGKLRMVCNDLLPEVEQWLRQGLIDFTIMQNPLRQGYTSLRIMYDLIFSGKRPESEYLYTETSIIIPECLERNP
ncbi:LacI family DNA-binding transcriptional regulator [Paenibacillus sp. GCM10023248]|uniref:LacI family DNA-binding transcriptional regulator n=1 Tax=unclassified Paenibacillus TaxID=185978 RepID=UPI002378B4B8|nr:LacI family DNA-binding transcriptional regulator [Paenibacillus sp. MAHUQ-63]MDD9268979.1 LacI family DNA-binding transcriptional regulator [Paenibacillus sp. MAHUQ-63]